MPRSPSRVALPISSRHQASHAAETKDLRAEIERLKARRHLGRSGRPTYRSSISRASAARLGLSCVLEGTICSNALCLPLPSSPQALLAQAKADYDDLKGQYENQLAVLRASFAKREKARSRRSAQTPSIRRNADVSLYELSALAALSSCDHR